MPEKDYMDIMITLKHLNRTIEGRKDHTVTTKKDMDIMTILIM